MGFHLTHFLSALTQQKQNCAPHAALSARLGRACGSAVMEVLRPDCRTRRSKRTTRRGSCQTGCRSCVAAPREGAARRLDARPLRVTLLGVALGGNQSSQARHADRLWLLPTL